MTKFPGITSRSREYVRTRASNVMSYDCQVERVTAGGYTDVDLIYTPGAREVLYTGLCRLWEVQGASIVAVGEEELMMSTLNASFPWDAPLFLKYDEIVILSAADDTAIVGTRYRVDSSARAGELRATRRYSVSTIQGQR